jgi:hypothetical protein
VRAAACGVALFACGGSTPRDARFPPRPEGCEVKVFDEAPTIATENIGPVRATCDADVDDEACMRTLKDEVCKLGGDVLWGVGPDFSMVYGKKRRTGRAAHSR